MSKQMASNAAGTRREIAAQEKALAEYNQMLGDLNALKEKGTTPAADLGGMEQEIQKGIEETEGKLKTLRDRLAVEVANEAPPEPPKWSVEAHPILGKLAQNTEPAKVESFNPGDVVEAKWTDKAWYKAKVTTVTGSRDNPRYTVIFTGYNTTLTVERDAVRAVQGTKRKVEHPPAPQSTSSTQKPSTTVYSAGPNLKPGVLNKPTDAADGTQEPPKKHRKIRSNKKLEASKNEWQKFQAKGPKAVKKESMFRTGTAPGARVGFTGSGKAMTKDAARVKNRFKQEDEEEEEEYYG